MSLEDEDGFTYGDLSVRRRPVALAVELRVVRLVLLEQVVDRCQMQMSTTFLLVGCKIILPRTLSEASWR